MHRLFVTISAVALSATMAFAQAPKASSAKKQPNVEFEMMTWPEVKTGACRRQDHGALLHGRHRAARAAERQWRPHADGTRDRPHDCAAPRQRDRDAGAAVHAEQCQRRSAGHDRSHPRNPQLDSRASHRTGDGHWIQERRPDGRPRRRPAGGLRRRREEDGREVRAEGKHVYFCDEVYAKAQGDFDKWLQEKGYPTSSHAGIPDTSTMLYLGGDKGWVRKELIPTAEGDPVPPPGRAAAAGAGAIRTRRRARTTASPATRASRPRRWKDGVRHQDRLRGEADPGVPGEPDEEHGSVRAG